MSNVIGHTVDITMGVFLWHQNGVRRCLACASGLRRSHDRGWVESQLVQSSKNGATVLTLWYEPLTRLAASTLPAPPPPPPRQEV